MLCPLCPRFFVAGDWSTGTCELFLARRRGNELLASKDLDGALAAYTKAIDLDGSDAVFRSNRSAVYMSKGEHEKALVDAEVQWEQA